ELFEWVFGEIQGRIVAKASELDPERFAESEFKARFDKLSMRMVWKLNELYWTLAPLIRGAVSALVGAALLFGGAPELLLLIAACSIPNMVIEAHWARRYFDLDEECMARIRDFWEGYR